MSAQFPLILALCALVTISVRAVPILFLSRVALPSLVGSWLRFIPVAIMAAIVAADLMTHPEITPSGLSASLIAAIVAMAAGLVSRSLFATVFAGVFAFLAVQAFS